MVFTPDGTLLATPTSDGSGTFLWDTRTRRKVATLRYKGHFALDAAISPDGRWLVVPGIYENLAGGGSRLQIWDLRTRRLARTVASPLRALSTATYSSDGRRLDHAGRARLSDRAAVAGHRVGHHDVDTDRRAVAVGR